MELFKKKGDPKVHPQPETYWGNVNPIGPRACYDESKRVAEAMCYAYAQQVNKNNRHLNTLIIYFILSIITGKCSSENSQNI